MHSACPIKQFQYWISIGQVVKGCTMDILVFQNMCIVVKSTIIDLFNLIWHSFVNGQTEPVIEMVDCPYTITVHHCSEQVEHASVTIQHTQLYFCQGTAHWATEECVNTRTLFNHM